MEQTPSTPQVHKKKTSKFLKVVPWVGLALFVIVAALNGYLYASKQLTFAFGSAAANPRASAVCGDAIISKYNAAMYYGIRGSNKDPTLDIVGIKELQNDIPTKAGYAKDPTCQTILFWISIQQRDALKAQNALTALMVLHEEGKYVDSNLSSTASLPSLQDALNALTADSRG